MSAKHTPGEWETGSGSDGSLYVCEEGGGDVIAEVVNRNVADRNLIAAAPELLEALTRLLQLSHTQGVTDQEWATAEQAGEDAIAKAERDEDV